MVGVGASIRRYVGWTKNMWLLIAIFPNSSEDDSAIVVLKMSSFWLCDFGSSPRLQNNYIDFRQTLPHVLFAMQCAFRFSAICMVIRIVVLLACDGR
jgi:hypothetical protein